MSKVVEFFNPAFEDGVEFDVGGLKIPNNGAIELTEEQELSFFSRHQSTVEDYFTGNEQVTVSGTTELSQEDRELHTGKDVNSQPPALDTVVLEDVEPPVDSTGEVVEDEETALELVNDPEEDAEQ